MKAKYKYLIASVASLVVVLSIYGFTVFGNAIPHLAGDISVGDTFDVVGGGSKEGGDFLDNTFDYEAPWYVDVNGEAEVGTMLFFRPTGSSLGDIAYNRGLTFAQPQTWARWFDTFNANEEYALNNFKELRSTYLQRKGDQDSEPYNLGHSRQLGWMSGAIVTQLERSYDKTIKYVNVQTTPWATGSVSAPNSATQGEYFNLTLDGEEFHPYASEMNFEIYIDGKKQTTETVQSSKVTNYTVPLRINDTGQHEIRVYSHDAVYRGEWAETNITIEASKIPPPPTDPPDEEEYGPPVADFDYAPNLVIEGKEVQFQDDSHHPDGLRIVDYDWDIDGASRSGRSPTYTKGTHGLISATLTVTDEKGSTDSTTQLIPVYSEPTAIIDTYIYDKTGDDTHLIDDNNNIINVIKTNIVRAGDPLIVDGRESYDRTGEELDFDWTFNGASETFSQTDKWGDVYYDQTGSFNIFLDVTNSVGLSDTDSTEVIVTDPVSYIDFKVGGHLKENRKVTLTDLTNSPERYPTDWDKSYYEIKPLDGQSESRINHVSSLGEPDNELLFEDDGDYAITLYIENESGWTGQLTKEITIAEDEKPVANFGTSEVIYRDSDNSNIATITIRDNSRSDDDDIIQERIWQYRYDTLNQYGTSGDFDSEEWTTLSDTNEELIELEVEDVGYYELRVKVKEQFGQPTIEQFVTDDDYRTNTSELRVVTVDNHAPVMEWAVPN
ncbi:PKD domain-containing protein [Halobacillus locisalis]|uniref:PKD domain-containing protein n=1 Tax=Halobacillus locisalis TaxID=220753 RepID=A0A838CYQ0_9BACI|nr:PKD domain-containing protein [Halobacillus locisalis]MBA2176835.1 PKD domain-containing protein [Halobacillus locisalis]